MKPAGQSTSHSVCVLHCESATRLQAAYMHTNHKDLHCVLGDPDEWDRQMYINLNAPMRLTRHFAPGVVFMQPLPSPHPPLSPKTVVHAFSTVLLTAWT